MNDIIRPIVHMNGTSRDALIDQLKDVYTALREVDNALCQAVPNGRDYYPEPGLMEKAQEQHERRRQIVSNLMDEIVAEVEEL